MKYTLLTLRKPAPMGPRVSGKTSRQWVDVLHDVAVADLELALCETYTAMEHVKRYTTVGMAGNEGQTSAMATLVWSLRAG